MSHRLSLSTLGILVLSATAAWAQDTRVIVIFHDTPDEGVITGRGGKVELRSNRSRMIAARIAPNKVSDISADENVASVVEDSEARIPVETQAKPSGAGGPPPPPPAAQSTPWGIARVDAPDAWAVTTGAGVKIAIVDTGIKSDHADLQGRVILGPNFVNAAKNSSDDNGHGTHCAGTAAAGDNQIGVVGVAPNATLVAVKVLDKQGNGWVSGIVSGIDWAADNSDVISMSLGTLSNVQALHDAVDAAAAQGVLVVAAGGNEGQIGSPALYPAAYSSVLAVAATDSSDNVPSFSTRGSYIDIAAPGVGVTSTWKDGGYKTLNGTSMATPHVSGAVALLIASGVTDVDDIRAALTSTADDINGGGVDNVIGNGLLDVEEAVTGTSSAP